jgi:hypothetical protein
MKRHLAHGLLLTALVLACGCVTTQPWIANFQTSGPAYVWCLWDARVHVTQDTVNHGQDLPGLAGRLYLSDTDFRNMDKSYLERGDGKLNVELFDTTNVKAGGERVRLGSWQLDGPTLVKLMRKDEKVGWGYTLFLPWPDYQPSVKRVELVVCYTPTGGYPMYAKPSPITLTNEIMTTVSQKLVSQYTPLPTK